MCKGSDQDKNRKPVSAFRTRLTKTKTPARVFHVPKVLFDLHSAAINLRDFFGGDIQRTG